MSHTFESLAASTTNPPTNAVECATKVRWIHVLRSRNILSLVANILRTGQIDIPASRSTSTTGESEAILGLPPSIYFYAGRAFPEDLAKAAIVVEQEALAERREPNHLIVAPFDTGAVAQNKTLLPADPAQPDRYVQEHSTGAANFQSYFAAFLASFFSEAEKYWNGVPTAIDGVVFSENSDFRNWTFELRCQEFASLPESHWFVDDDSFGVLQRAILTSGANGVTVTHQSDNIAMEVENAAKNWALA